MSPANKNDENNPMHSSGPPAGKFPANPPNRLTRQPISNPARNPRREDYTTVL